MTITLFTFVVIKRLIDCKYLCSCDRCEYAEMYIQRYTQMQNCIKIKNKILRYTLLNLGIIFSFKLKFFIRIYKNINLYKHLQSKY